MAVAADVPVDRVVMVVGATGLVGREVLAALSADKQLDAIHVVGRRAPAVTDKRVVAHSVDFRHLPELPRCDAVYIALGTTIKVAGSQAAFRAVDHDAVLAVARAAHAAGARRLAVVSAMGADAGSRIFYNRVKGETEAALQAIGYDTLVIARPSLLVGDRAALAQPVRAGERIGQSVMQLLGPLIPANYRAITAAAVAAAMLRAMATGRAGVHILPSGQMQP